MRNREDESLFAGRIRDLARQAEQNGYVTHTGFLSLSEQSSASSVLAGPDIPQSGKRGVFFGGTEEADRKVLFFLPSYVSEEDLRMQEEAGEGILSCLKVTHRDYLGSLMGLGLTREKIGDILLEKDGTCAWVFVLGGMAEHICRELTTIGRAHVDVEIAAPSACTARPVLVSRNGSIASVRIDSLVAMVFRISRSAAQELVAREEVFADGRNVTSSSFSPPAGSRISVRGHGKFIFEGEEKTTKKGRIFVRTSVFS